MVEGGTEATVKDAKPQFQVLKEPRWRAWREALEAVWTPPLPGLAFPGRPPELFARQVTPRQRPGGRALGSSGLLHLSVTFFLLQTPYAFFLPQPPEEPPEEIVYELKSLVLSKYLPSLRAPGPGGRPGRGTRPDRPPARGSTAFHPKLILVSNPPNPDSFRQTIIQSSSPPDLKIRVDLPLPNVVVGTPIKARKQPVDFRLDLQVRASSRQEGTAASQAPDVSARPSDLVIAPSPALNPMPRLEVAPPTALASVEGARADASGIAERASANWAGGDPGGLLILGVDPALMTGTLSLPPGNRLGAFSISPAGGQPGSPGGVPGGDPLGGTGGPGTGGDGSTGVGPGGGGGGGGAGASGPVTISGGSGGGSGFGGAASETGSYAASLPTSLVYPVQVTPRPRLGSLTVSTGPIGGGGLRVYGVLRGGKVYTIYLPMPGKNWVLEYVHPSRSAAPIRGKGQTHTTVARLDHGLAPPWAEEQFDFRRPPVPADKADEFIILRGWIREDGSVDKLRVFQGIEPLADQAALAAFSRWKFQPALQGGKAVAVEILVGVPAQGPAGAEEPQPPAGGV